MFVTKFFGFYTTPPFWASNGPPGFADQHPESVPNLHDLMSPLVLERTIGALALRISYDGLVELRRPDLEELLHPPSGIVKGEDVRRAYSAYMRHINALCVCFDIGCMEAHNGSAFHIEELTKRDVCRTTYHNGKILSGSIAVNSVAGHYQLGRFQSSYRSGIPLSFDIRFQQRRPATVQTLEVGLRSFGKICRDEEQVEKMAIYAKALSDFNRGDYSTSVVLCWFLLERALFERYEAFIEQKSKSGKHVVDGDRYGLLTGRDFTASVVSQVLELNERIQPEELERLDTIRKFRNSIAHHLKKKLPGKKDCQGTLEFTLTFVFGDVLDKPRINLLADGGFSI